MNNLFSILVLIFIGSLFSKTQAQTTSIPDANFEQRLIHLGIDSDGVINGQILTADALAVTSLDASHRAIADLTGIEAFTNLEELDCLDNQLTVLDLSNNPALKILDCRNNQLTSLDFTNNPLLEEVSSDGNTQLNSLNVSNNPALKVLSLRNNNLSSLDVTNNTVLETLYCSQNQLTSLDISNNTALERFACFTNQISSLDLSNNTALKTLDCAQNQLTSLDISNNTVLEFLHCSQNQLSSLDVSNNNLLDDLRCNANNIAALDITNNIDLRILYCSDNQLTSLNLSNNTALQSIECTDNQLTNLDISANIILEYFYCNNNNINNITFANNNILLYIGCTENNLTSLDVSNSPLLVNLQCANNQLTNLDLSNNPVLEYLYCHDNNLATLDLSGNTALTNLYCYNNNLTTLDLSDAINLEWIECYQNQLSNIILADPLHSLDVLSASDNLLAEINLKSLDPNSYNGVILTNNLQNLAICVDLTNINLQNTSWQKDSSAFYTDNCGVPVAVKGQIVIDQNGNCAIDSNETSMFSTTFLIENGVDSFYVSTYDDVNYIYNLDTGTYTITPITNAAWVACPANQQITVDTNFILQTIDFVLQPATVPCPWLTVDISAPFIRQTGWGTNYTVAYCNDGSLDASNVFVEVELDLDLTVLGTSIPIFSQVNNIYTFNIGDVLIGECGSFNINIIADSTTLQGQSICSEARILPISPCITSQWSGAIITVDGECLGDSIEFLLTNIGSDLLQPLQYIVYEDNIIFRPASLTHNLANGQTQSVMISVNTGSAYRIEVAQLANFPSVLGDPVAIAVIEGCLPNPDGSFNLGLINNLYIDDSAPFVDIDCQEVVTAYDPNDKTGYPEGYGPNHYIEENTPLEYRVRFQNTGNDTAFNIVIMDTLSSHLDLSTLQMGASSHSYTWQLTGNELRVNFNNILLPDSTTDEPGSNGFFKYNIQQKQNNPIGTIIYNQAAIYFDYNPPIYTNTTFHEIGEDFIPIEIESNIEQSPISESNFKVYPNPTKHLIYVENEQAEATQIQIYDALGRLILRDYTKENPHQIDLSQYHSGIYWLILNSKDKTQSFKLIKQ